VEIAHFSRNKTHGRASKSISPPNLRKFLQLRVAGGLAFVAEMTASNSFPAV
jgi:hypothetical protein